MRARSLWLNLVCLLCLLAAGTGLQSPASAAGESGRRVAFVVGNSAYRAVPALRNPVNDARAVAAALKRAGFDVITAFDVDRVAFESDFRTFVRSLEGAETSLFYYSGHGIQVGGDNRLIPIDAALKTSMDLEVETISVKTILSYMQSASRQQLIFLDSCRNNPFPAKAYYVGTELEQAARSGGLAAQPTSSGSLIAFSTQPGNVAEDGSGEFSPFTAAFLDNGFKLGADLQSSLMKVTREVSEKTAGRQVPWNNSSLTEPVYLARPSIMIAAADDAQEQPDQSATTVQSQPEPQPAAQGNLAQNVADLISSAFQKPHPVPIGVGAVALLGDFPLLRGEPGIKVELAKAPAAGVLYLDSDALIEGSVIKPANLPQVKYEPAIGSEGASLAVQWNVSDANANGVAVDGKLAPYIVDCDREAGEPLDLQGVVKGKLPNEIDPSSAIPACESAVKDFPNAARYKYQLGRAKLSAHDVAGAAALFKEAAEAGHTRALYQLGNLAARGIEREQNMAEAEEYYRRSAELGDPYAMAAHGRNLLFGQGVAADPAEGLKFLNRAVELGHTYAMNSLGSLYYQGGAVQKNPERGVRFFQTGLARGDIYSMNNLGIAYLDGSGVKKDYAKALRLFMGASEGGHPAAPNNIGRMYFNGIGVKKDLEQAIKWYQLGAERGDTWAAANLGWIYANGPKKLRDIEKAVSYYALSAALDFSGDNMNAATSLKALPEDAKARAIKKLMAEKGTLEVSTASTLEGTLLLLQRSAWLAKNPRHDLF